MDSMGLHHWYILESLENKTNLEQDYHTDVKLSKYYDIDYFIGVLRRFEKGIRILRLNM